MAFTHIDANGNAVMVDVSEKAATERTAVARGRIRMSRQCFEAVKNRTAKKGDVLGVAQIAGIMASKHTADLIPLCHRLNLIQKHRRFFPVRRFRREMLRGSRVHRPLHRPSRVEMRALTGVCAALLTVYDMCKAIDRGMVIEQVHLVEKHGGKSGDFSFQEGGHD